MMKENVQKLLNDQINAEYHAAYLYHAMSAYCEQIGFKGFACWLNNQAKEELAHGFHIFKHLLERGVVPHLTEIEAPLKRFEGVKEIFEQSLEHEKYITQRIDTIASLAMRESDHATYQFILWYVKEQIEEEGAACDIVQRIKLIGDNQSMLLILDAEMAARTFMDPFA